MMSGAYPIVEPGEYHPDIKRIPWPPRSSLEVDRRHGNDQANYRQMNTDAQINRLPLSDPALRGLMFLWREVGVPNLDP